MWVGSRWEAGMGRVVGHGGIKMEATVLEQQLKKYRSLEPEVSANLGNLSFSQLLFASGFLLEGACEAGMAMTL